MITMDLYALKIEEGDLTINSRGELVTVAGKDEEVQAIERALTTGQGEWFLNELHGLKYDEVLGKALDEERSRLAITEAIYQDPRVESVENIRRDFDRATRKAVWHITVKMESGNIVEAVINGE